MSDEILDATGLKCPLPVLKAQKRLKSMAVGQRLQVSATDPGAPADLRALCETRGHVYFSEAENDGTYVVTIVKG